MQCLKNILDQKMLLDSLKYPLKHSVFGVTKEKLNILEPQADIDDTVSIQSCLYEKKKILKSQLLKPENQSVIVESLLTDKKKIWKDKLNSFHLNTRTTSLSKKLDQALISKEKGLTPFWTLQSKEISKKLWLPTKIDYVDSVLISSKESSKTTPMGKSWFSIKKKHPLKKNSLMTSFQSSLFSLPDSMDSEVIQSKTKSKKKPTENKNLKTIKIRLFPNEKEKEQLQLSFDQFKWYYNSVNTVFHLHYGKDKILDKNKYSNYTVRDIFRKYKYTETEYKTEDNILVFKDFIYDEKLNKCPVPLWWENNVHNRISRGATDKFISSINSAITNYKNKNINHFDMKYMSQKSPTSYLHFEDSSYPSFIKNIKSNYWYTNKERKRIKVSFNELNCKKRGLEIIYEKETGRYFLHYPVERDWFPEDDKRNDSQIKFINKGNRIISLDPGVRKFLVGYDPTGESIFIGEGANKELMKLLYEVDTIEDKKTNYLAWKKIKNLISELHWKTISFLIENYDIILLPDFRISGMIKSKKLSRMTKRLMCMYSFHSFKTKLKWKCDMYKKQLIIVDESYTSCTCTNCGIINNTKGKEELECKDCKMKIDRDVAGSRNIMIKNVSLRCTQM